MKRIFALLAFTVAATASLAAQTPVDRTIWVAPGGFVRIWNLTGSVRVIGWDQDSLQVRGAVDEPPDGEFVISPGKQGAKVSVWGSTEIGARPSDLVIRVPRRSQLWVKTQSATITVSDFEGGLDAVSVTGAIEVSGRPRELYAESMGGAVNLAVTTRSVRVKTGSGQVTLRGSIDDAMLTTVSGNVFAENAQVTQGRFESVEGGIRYRGHFRSPSALEFINHSGDIELVVPANAAAAVSIDTFEGEFQDEFGVPAKQTPGKVKGRQFSFTIGRDPGAEVAIRNFKGVVILRKAAVVKT